MAIEKDRVDTAYRLQKEMRDLLSTSFRIVQSGSTTGSVAFRKRAHRWMEECRANNMPWLIVLAVSGNLFDSETSDDEGTEVGNVDS